MKYTYRELQAQLNKADASYLASEAQAMACGLLVANNTADESTWGSMLLEGVKDSDQSKGLLENLSQLFEDTKLGLQDEGFSVSLLLPDDEESLEERFVALQQWCRGFLIGLSLAGITDFKKLPNDTQEIIQDFAQISASTDFDLSGDEESERAYIEISEYVSVSTLLVNEELQPIIDTTQNDSSTDVH